MFGALRGRVIDADFLDLCSGTGNVGLEALSQGARSTTFVESNHHCIRLIESNLEKCGLSRKHPQVQLIRLEAGKALKRLGKRGTHFDLIYFDPPYSADIYISCLTLISQHRLLAMSGTTVVEHRHGMISDQSPWRLIDALTLYNQKKYGDTVLSFYQWAK